MIRGGVPVRKTNSIRVTDPFWRNYIELVKKEVIPYQWKVLNDQIPGTEPSHAIENFRIAAGEVEGDFYGFVFQDSDVYKWLESVAYILEDEADPELEKRADEVIDLIGRAQKEDGYLNTYYQIRKPDERWTNLRDDHELYCAGHLIEAAVAYYHSTGKRKLLDIACKFVDYIDTVFGTEEGKIPGYPGHQEIELALLRLYEITKDEKHLNLCKFFIDQRGQEPHYFDIEKEKRGETGPYWYSYGYKYSQSHMPVREQDVAVGHSVRAVYMYTAMADLAKKIGDESLTKACERLWDNVTKKQMYITAGIGSSEYGESFTFDYDLPNDTSYTETCASIGLVFWARKMLDLDVHSKYADVMERALYNGTISGMQLNGKSFFYVNPLEVFPKSCELRGDKRHVKTVRQSWFPCACCPPNLARLIGSISKYIYSSTDKEIFVHLYMGNESTFQLGENTVHLTQMTKYPWNGNVEIVVNPENEGQFTIALRLPGWCKNFEVRVNGEFIELNSNVNKGYLQVNRLWKKGDTVQIYFSMPVERIRSNPQVRENIGKVAIQRGPIVYCLEEEDNGANLPGIYLPKDTKLRAEFDPELLGGVVKISGEALRIKEVSWNDELYSSKEVEMEPISITAVPYYAWCNRTPGEMIVWIHEL